MFSVTGNAMRPAGLSAVMADGTCPAMTNRHGRAVSLRGKSAPEPYHRGWRTCDLYSTFMQQSGGKQ
jgi:hypothetical protein